MDTPHPDPRVLLEAGEPFGAGFCECADAAPFERYARAYRRWLEHGPLPEYGGGRLGPGGPKPGATAAMAPDYSFTFRWSQAACDAKLADAGARTALEQLRQVADHEGRKVVCLHGEATAHGVGGAGYTHGIANYGRVLAEGLDAYEARIRAGLAAAADAEARSFHAGLLDLLAGVRAWHGRLLDQVARQPASNPQRAPLLAALARVPFQPARSLYEAMVAYNVVYYLDGCDNPGRLDAVLAPYYDAAPDRAEAIELLSEFADNVSANGGWSAAIGGTRADGSAAYLPMTGIVLAATHGRYRPSLELRVRPDMPDALWDAAFDSLASGNGQPAFYNEPGYLRGLREAGLGLAEADLVQWNGGGCTETMIHGCSNVGSLDAGFNLPLVFTRTLMRELAGEAATFERIVEAFKADLRADIREVLGQLNAYFAARARHRPQPVRSLLVDDCVARGKDFNAGGARYNASVVNVAGLANVADALEALRTVVFGERAVTPRALRDILERDFDGHEALRLRLLAAPKYGNDQAGVDGLARDIADTVYREIRAFPCSRGGRFLPSHIMFETFGWAGKPVGAMPDGRRAGEPLADSAGPVQGRDTQGPTAVLKSVAGLPQSLAIGTPVLNMRLARSALATPAARQRVRSLIETYFRLGGLQLQVSVADRAELEDALVHPERHASLIVRIGGYSTYFNRLSPELQREVVKRTEYGGG